MNLWKEQLFIELMKFVEGGRGMDLLFMIMLSISNKDRVK